MVVNDDDFDFDDGMDRNRMDPGWIPSVVLSEWDYKSIHITLSGLVIAIVQESLQRIMDKQGTNSQDLVSIHKRGNWLPNVVWRDLADRIKRQWVWYSGMDGEPPGNEPPLKRIILPKTGAVFLKSKRCFIASNSNHYYYYYCCEWGSNESKRVNCQ